MADIYEQADALVKTVERLRKELNEALAEAAAHNAAATQYEKDITELRAYIETETAKALEVVEANKELIIQVERLRTALDEAVATGNDYARRYVEVMERGSEFLRERDAALEDKRDLLEVVERYRRVIAGFGSEGRAKTIEALIHERDAQAIELSSIRDLCSEAGCSDPGPGAIPRTLAMVVELWQRGVCLLEHPENGSADDT